VAQVKKKVVRDAIEESANELFSRYGYHNATLQQIAAGAGIGVSSLYSYFPSKLHLVYAIVSPWLTDAFARLERKIAKLRSGRARLKALLLGIWRDIPLENIGLANSLIEALASADPKEGKPVPLLKWVEDKVRGMLVDALPEKAAGASHIDVLPHLIMMAYDGFVINRRLNDVRDIERMADAMCDLILGGNTTSPRLAKVE
jgi:AcrR family transcriptional regulator